MAVIECVFNYDEKTKKLSQVIHVLKLDPSDKINFVTAYPGLTLKTEEDCPLLNLRKDDYAPVRFTTALPETNKITEFKVYYHGPQAHFACGRLDGNRDFYPWKTGQPSPDSNPP